MKTIIGDWVGKNVTVALNGGMAGTVKFVGTLVQVGDDGVLVQLPKGQTFVPTYAILHISLMNE